MRTSHPIMALIALHLAVFDAGCSSDSTSNDPPPGGGASSGGAGSGGAAGQGGKPTGGAAGQGASGASPQAGHSGDTSQGGNPGGGAAGQGAGANPPAGNGGTSGAGMAGAGMAGAGMAGAGMAGASSGGDCCTPTPGLAGCAVPEINSCVCLLNSTCCQDAWSETCVALAATQCGNPCGPTCADDSDCKDPTSPRCFYSGACVECISDKDCQGTGKPNCTNAGRCIECSVNGDCKDPTKPSCNAETCSPACSKNTDCQAPALPFCDFLGDCTACHVDKDCLAQGLDLCQYGTCHRRRHSDADCKSPHSPACNLTNGFCTPCNSSADCQDPASPICHEIAGFTRCVGCETDADCKDPKNPVCSQDHCSPCSASACKSNPLCSGSGACDSCTTSADCKDPAFPACSIFHSCKQCASDFDCAAGQLCDVLGGVCISSGQCVGDDPTEDADDNPKGAIVLVAAGQLSGEKTAKICNVPIEESDYYSIKVEQPAQLDATLSWPTASKMLMRFYDEKGTSIKVPDPTMKHQQTLSQAVQPGVYYLAVWRPDGGLFGGGQSTKTTPYTISVKLTP